MNVYCVLIGLVRPAIQAEMVSELQVERNDRDKFNQLLISLFRIYSHDC